MLVRQVFWRDMRSNRRCIGLSGFGSGMEALKGSNENNCMMLLLVGYIEILWGFDGCDVNMRIECYSSMHGQNNLWGFVAVESLSGFWVL